jgi:hypothetical protein
MNKYEVNSLKNVDFSQFQDEFGNLIKKFEVVVYFKNSDGEWVEDRRFESGRSYYIVDGQLYNKCCKSLLPLNMDFDSETCGACYQIVEEVKETKKITNNEVLFTCKGIKTLSLHKQSYSDNTCFYSLQDWRGNFKLSYGSKNLQDILNQIIAEKQIHEKSYLEDNNGQVLEIYNKYMKMYDELINSLNKVLNNETNKINDNKLCETYFEFDNKIINGWKVIENNNNTYEVYSYTSCKKLGNWQLFLTFDDKETMLRYFRNQISNTIEKLDNDWCRIEHEWFKNTYEELNKKIA